MTRIVVERERPMKFHKLDIRDNKKGPIRHLWRVPRIKQLE